MPGAPSELSPSDIAYLARHLVGHLSTTSRAGQPHVIPVCFTLYAGQIIIPLDEKPKQVAAGQLRRVRNLQENRNVAFVVDDYDEDWRKLSYLLVRGVGELRNSDAADHPDIVDLLCAKYPQYAHMPLEQSPTIRIVPTAIVRWAWTVSASSPP
jgi:PPOX class probable F420-dependent enzyme